jgi:hypothetical protein
MSQANRYLGGFCSSQRIFPPQTIRCCYSWERLYRHGPFACMCYSTSCTDHGGVAVCGFVYICHAHHRTPVQWGWHADSRSVTRAPQTGDGWPTTGGRLWLYEYSSYPRPHRCVSRLALGTQCPAGSRGHETTRCFCEDRGSAVPYPWRDAAPQRDSASRSCLESSPLPASLGASRLPRPSAGGGYRVHPQKPSSQGPANARDETECGLTARSGMGRHFWPRAWPVPTPNLSRGASGARFPLRPRCHVWPGASR